jgi:nitroreductase
MELLEAIKSRRSIRAYKPDPVPKRVLAELLEVATRAPSGSNTQPWEFIVLTGEMLGELNRVMMERLHSGKMTPDPDEDMPFTFPTGLYKERSAKFYKKVLAVTKMREWYEKSISFFDAPAAIVIVTDKSAPQPWWLFDMGLISQTIAIAAQNYGLGTCMVGHPAAYPKDMRTVLSIPESKRIVVGIAIGYPDWDHPLNSVRTDRDPVEKLVIWHGMDEGEENIS